ncbi:MBL fold metallo-hydrolase [Cellulomonas persica]|uniref:MBL fold metallo-hydrolase n=1 Tax=Cellulomonas persica TaxID=76861 RepID=A0A510UW82_9CELL|nr:MBL fold metallo-hydrolase [Cellulomonas persica]GEK18819.1 MBL fold metallo-hydrolase [Cellulomonas persica]
MTELTSPDVVSSLAEGGPTPGLDPTPDVVATWVGGPTVRLSYAGLTFLTDPTFDPAPAEYPGPVTLHKLVGPAVAVDELGALDVVLLSHDQHADNLDMAGRALLADVPVVLSTPDAAARVPGVRGLAPWEQVVLDGDVRVTAVPARHGPQGAEPLSGAVTGFVLEAHAWPTVYVSGDNASIDVVDQVARRFPQIGLAVLFVGGANVGRFGAEPVTLDALRAAAVVELLAPARVVPVHHTDWSHFVEPLSTLVERLERGARSDRLVVLERGRPTAV